MEDKMTVLRFAPRENFVVTPSVEAICERAEGYLSTGFPVHLRGPAGTGKTTLAMHLAATRGKPVMLIYGDEEFNTSDLVGAHNGVTSKRLVDNFIRSVVKTEEDVRTKWTNQRLTSACKYGYTLVYDEFLRSRPEANNVLLGVLEEKLLVLPESLCGETYIQVHPDFRAIFTSNPEEYAGIHKAQDALLDRMITIELDHCDRETEVAITMAKSKLPRGDAEKIVAIVRGLRAEGSANPRASMRACIMIGCIAAGRGARVSADDPFFVRTCIDVIGLNSFRGANGRGVPIGRVQIEDMLSRDFPSNLARELDTDEYCAQESGNGKHQDAATPW